MKAPAAVERLPQRRELIGASLLTAVVAIVLLLAGPAPGDAPAHLYRTFLVHQGTYLWDNFWYSGNYPLASYSFLYYLPAALVGNLPLVLASAVVSTALFASITLREFGRAALWPARLFAVFAAAPVFTGLYSYSLGFTAMLATLKALQTGRRWLAWPLAAVTLGFSPLAFVFLCLILAAVVVGERRLGARSAVTAVALGVIGAGGLAIMLIFPSGGVFPFHLVDLCACLALCSFTVALAWRAPHGKALAALFLLWGLGSLLCYFLPTPIGDNITRLRAFALPLVLLVGILAGFRPRWIAAIAITGALAYNLTPYLMLIPYRLDARPATAAFWRPATAFVAEHSTSDYRVEVVPTAAHWEAYWAPRWGIPIARGFYRQLDLAVNKELFAGKLTAARFQQWLRAKGVRYVVLPRTKLDTLDPSVGPEAALLRSGASGLRLVFDDRTATVYELPDATPLLTGPAAAHVVSLRHEGVFGDVAAPGTYRLRVRYTPYWQASPSAFCVSKAGDGNVELHARDAGSFALRFDGDTKSVLTAVGAEKAPVCP